MEVNKRPRKTKTKACSLRSLSFCYILLCLTVVLSNNQVLSLLPSTPFSFFSSLLFLFIAKFKCFISQFASTAETIPSLIVSKYGTACQLHHSPTQVHTIFSPSSSLSAWINFFSQSSFLFVHILIWVFAYASY